MLLLEFILPLLKGHLDYNFHLVILNCNFNTVIMVGNEIHSFLLIMIPLLLLFGSLTTEPFDKKTRPTCRQTNRIF